MCSLQEPKAKSISEGIGSWVCPGLGQKKTVGAKWEGQANGHHVVWSLWVVLYLFFAVCVLLRWVSLLLSSSLILGLTCPRFYGKGPLLPLMVLCSDSETCNVEPSGSFYGNRFSYFWDACSLTCVSSLFRVANMLSDQWMCMTRTWIHIGN